MSEAKGIKETKEALVGALAIVKVAAEVLKDGAQLSDLVDGFSKLNSDPEKKALIEQALAGIQELPAEIKDIDLKEGAELAGVLIKELPALIDAFKKPEPAPAPAPAE